MNDEVYRNGEPGDLAVGMVCALSSATGGRVVRARADDATRMPAIGFVAKIVGTRVYVRPYGPIRVPLVVLAPDTQIVQDAPYYVSNEVPGSVSRTKPKTGTVQMVALGLKLPRALHVQLAGTVGAQDTANLVTKQANLSGQANDNNVLFTLPEAVVAGTMRVYRNGQRLVRTTHFAEASPTTFQLLDGIVPKSGEVIEVEYAIQAS